MDRFTERSAIRMRFRVEGDGPDLVLIHGVGGRLEAWDGVVDRLKDGFRTVRYDLRGHGETEKPEGPYELDDFVDDLRSLLDEIGIARCALAGFSLGGLVAQAAALAMPDRFDRLALLSTVCGRNDEERRRVLERLDLVAKGIAGQHFEDSLARWFTEEFRAANPEVIARYAARNRQNDPAAYAAAYRVLAISDLADRLHEITIPTLIATGESDIGSNTRMARLMHDRIAGSRLRIFPRLRHSILIEAPDQVADLLGDFLAGPAQTGEPK